MRLAALSLGYGIDTDAIDGSVAGVFARACVVRLDHGGAITLLVRDAGNLPFGIVIDTPAGFTFAAAAEKGRVAARGGVLRLEGTAFEIDLRPARQWRSGMAALGANLRHEPVRAAWRAAAMVLVEDERAWPFLRSARTPIAALLEAGTGNDLEVIADAAARLIGLGDGTTPAGDDILVGFLGGLWATSGDRASRQTFAAACGAQVAALAARTQWLSGTYLAAAAAGEVSERLTELAASIAVGDAPGAGRAAREGVAIGHNSGACMVAGLLFGSMIRDVPRSALALLDHAVTPEPIASVPA